MKTKTIAAILAATIIACLPTTTAHQVVTHTDMGSGDCEWNMPAIVCAAGGGFCTVFTQCYVEVAGCYVGYNPDFNEPFYSGCH